MKGNVRMLFQHKLFVNVEAVKMCQFVIAGLILLHYFLSMCQAADLNPAVNRSTASGLKPQQVHLSYGETATSVIVMWATVLEDKSIVEYHTGNLHESKQVEGETLKLLKDNSAGANYLHRVVLEHLTPGQKYLYHARGESDQSLSDQYSFTIPRELSGNKYQFMVYSDLGTNTKSMQFLLQDVINKQDKEENYEAVFHLGNIANDLDRGEGQVGDKFLNSIQKVAARTPYMTAPGERERFNNFLHYSYRFSMGSLPWPMPFDNLWYSFDIGPIHFVIYSTEVFFGDDERTVESMITWLKDDLDKANLQRSAKPWIIAMGHRPMYCSVNDQKEDCTKKNSLVRTYLEELFYAEGVDLVISGHYHYYERTWPVYKDHALQYNYKDPLAPVHITIGSLGTVYRAESSTNVGDQWSAFLLSEANTEAFGKLEVFNATHLRWEVRECKNDRLIDGIWIIQPFHRPFSQPRVLFPNPLGEYGEKWLQNDNQQLGLESFLGLNGHHYGDDYQTKLTVLVFVFVLCVLGLIARNKVLTLLRICCFKQEPCKKMGTSISGVNGTHSV